MDETDRTTARSTPEDRWALTEPARIVRKVAFRAILETERPWDPMHTRDLPLDTASVAAAIDELVDTGRAYTDRNGRVTAAAGLSTDPTAQRIELSAGSRWTNCAYDALGILGALGADGRIETHSPATGSPIHIRFEKGRPLGSTAVLFLADDSCCTRPNDEWCPNVNLFEDEASASGWARERGVAGRVVSLDEGTDLGAAEWRPLVSGLEHLGHADMRPGRVERTE